ncbi:hypothetical protein BC939DRAFT_506781 [Gamsiella multidivaricata]|uniref:uncharacterized protein n=1 Tax=Gamsiella multidivaricata TaxID=101098 RepID=UPI00221E89CA|nr:uncharacterized protein BC939DRAFT_506781 [Gamsiella multidivaricata]KAI7818152.1 hypothetical protein BC939DRAFT_506781 [Gamsiella multidivaricata]
MATPGGDEKHEQQCRTQSTSKATKIPSRLDKTAGERYNLWRHIQLLTLLSISYCPGVVLEVVVEDINRGTIAVPEAASHHTTGSAVNPSTSSESSHDIVAFKNSLGRDIADELQHRTGVMIAPREPFEQNRVVESVELRAVVRYSLQEQL